ncbi:MAG TPA: transcriptional repressor [Solirubrobacterales bacterium]|nr:transcriptional repressor [Solirubrobacterales bacterium]
MIDAPDLESAIDAVRAGGLRMTTARQLLLDALYETDQPQSAEELAARLGPGSDVASVYRNLEAFERLGLVRHAHLGHGPGLYSRTSLGEREYLICDACGAHLALDPFELDEVRELVRERFRYEARFTHFPIAGLCPRCAAED